MCMCSVCMYVFMLLVSMYACMHACMHACMCASNRCTGFLGHVQFLKDRYRLCVGFQGLW